MPSSHSTVNDSMAIAEIKGNLVAASLARTTRQAYDRFWAKFVEFLTSNNSYHDMPFSATVISDFVAYLHLKNYKPSSISSHLSAITYFHQVARFPDPCDDVIVKRMILGCKKLTPSFDQRLPLLKVHIKKLIVACDHIFKDNMYDRYLYKAIILVTYNGFFRMGELLPRNLRKCNKVIQFNHVHLTKSHVSLKLHNYKTKKEVKPIDVTLQRTKVLCPIKSLHRYLTIRGARDGPLFISSLNTPITISKFKGVFDQLLDLCHLSRQYYHLHSFRIGACTQAILSGIPEQTIMQMGRWKSNAFKRYIRLANVRNPVSSSKILSAALPIFKCLSVSLGCDTNMGVSFMSICFLCVIGV